MLAAIDDHWMLGKAVPPVKFQVAGSETCSVSHFSQAAMAKSASRGSSSTRIGPGQRFSHSLRYFSRCRITLAIFLSVRARARILRKNPIEPSAAGGRNHKASRGLAT